MNTLYPFRSIYDGGLYGCSGWDGCFGFDRCENSSRARTFDDLGSDWSRDSVSMSPDKLLEETLTRSVIGAFYEVYNHLGFGFLESLYASALERELLAREHDVMREFCVRVIYKGQELGAQKLDMIVDDKLVVEIKSTLELHKSATRQLYNYLHATNLEVGLLLHFGPRASFYRVLCRHSKYNPEHPSNPEHPYTPPS